MKAESLFKMPRHSTIFMEGRVILELGDYFKSISSLIKKHSGNDDPILILPGFLVGDSGTYLMRNFLNDIGYNASAWDLGVNRGPTEKTMIGVRDKVKFLADKHGKPVSLVGWSLGGIYAREIAKDIEDEVKTVITMGTPFKGMNAETVISYFERAGIDGLDTLTAGKVNQLDVSPPQPYTSIFSKSDKLINWEACIDDDHHNQNESVEINSSHFGLCHNPQSLEIIAKRLKQDVDNWTPYQK